MMAWFRNFLENRHGAAAAEMALLLPLLTVMLFVTFEGGYFLWNEHKVVKGVRDGARYAGRLDFSNYDCGTETFTGDQTPIKNLTRTGQLTGGTATVLGWQDAHVSISVECESAQGLYSSNAGNAPLITVQAAVPYPSSPLSGLAAVLGFDTSGIQLNASAESPVAGL